MDRQSAADLRRRLDESHREFVRAQHHLLRAVAEVLDTSIWHVDGSTGPSQYLAHRLAVKPETARQWVKDAESLRTRPELDAAMSCGDVSVDQAKAILTLTQDEPDTDGVWIEACEQGLSAADLAYEARRFTASKLEADGRARFISLTHTDDEKYVNVRGRLLSEEGAILMTALDAHVPEETPFGRWGDAWADSLMALATGRETGGKNRPTVVVYVDESDLKYQDGVAETACGHFLDPAAARALTCDASIEYVVEKFGKPIAVWPARRRVPEPMRRALKKRDRTCRFPGCGNTKDLDAHHIIHWADGGETVLENLVLLCGGCHLRIHRNHWTFPRRE